MKCALAQVFQSLATAYPTSMLRRLAELAESPEPTVGEAVSGAIKALWDDPELRPRLYEGLRAWSESSKPSMRQAATNAFLRLAVNVDKAGLPELLARGDVPLSWVIDGWRRALEELDLGSLTLEVGSIWLDAAAGGSEAQQRVTDVLVRAVHDTLTGELRGIRYLNLVRIAENWRIFGHALDESTRNQRRAELVDRTRGAMPRSHLIEGSAGE